MRTLGSVCRGCLSNRRRKHGDPFTFTVDDEGDTLSYEGMLLHYVSPRLAQTLYPCITSAALNVTMALAMAVGSVGPLISLLRGPSPALYMSYMLYAPALQRVLTADMRILWLLLWEFETGFLLANWLIACVMLHVGLFDARPLAYMAFHAVFCLPTALLLDAVRLPSGVLLVMTLSIATQFLALSAMLAVRVLPSTEYGKMLIGTVTVVSVFYGRLATFAAFFAKYSVKLWLRCDNYVVLRRPVLRRVLAEGQWRPGDMSRTATWRILEASSTTKVAPEAPDPSTCPPPLPTAYDDLLLHAISPRLAAAAYPWITSRAGLCLFGACLMVGSSAALPLAWDAAPLPLFCLSFLLYVPAAQLMTLVDLVVLRRLLMEFETFFVNCQWAMCVACVLWGVLDPGLPTIYAFNVAAAALFVYVLDAIRLPPRLACGAAAIGGFMTLSFGILYSLQWVKHTNYSIMPFGHYMGVRGATFLGGRFLTVAAFFIKDALRLWLRPEAYAIISRPVTKNDSRHLRMKSLSQSGRLHNGPIAVTVRWEDEDKEIEEGVLEEDHSRVTVIGMGTPSSRGEVCIRRDDDDAQGELDSTSRFNLPDVEKAVEAAPTGSGTTA